MGTADHGDRHSAIRDYVRPADMLVSSVGMFLWAIAAYTFLTTNSSICANETGLLY